MSTVKLDADYESTNSSGMAVANPLTICGRFPWCAGDIVPCCLFLRTARLTSAFSVYDNTTHSPCTQFQLLRNLLLLHNQKSSLSDNCGNANQPLTSIYSVVAMCTKISHAEQRLK